MLTKDSKGNPVYKFAPTEVSDLWLNSDDFRSDGLHLYKWDETHWRKLDDLDAHALALAELRIIFAPALWLATVTNAKNSVAAAKLHLLESAEMQDHTSHPMIPLLNGYLYMDDGILLGHMKEDYLQHVVNCNYKPGETAPRFMQYLEAALPDPEVRSRVQEFIGSTLLADDFGLHQQWLGRGAHALAKVLRELLGNAKVTTDTLDELRVSALVAEGEGYDTKPLKAGVDSVIRAGRSARQSTVNARYATPKQIDIGVKRIVLSELAGPINDPSAAYFRRWDIVPFVDTPDCSEYVINGELRGVFNWALAGLRQVIERGGFTPRPEGVKAVVTRAKNDASTIQAWIEARSVRVSAKAKIARSAAHLDYSIWCESQDLKPMANNIFWTHIHDVLHGIVSERKPLNGRQTRVCNISIGVVQLAAIAA